SFQLVHQHRGTIPVQPALTQLEQMTQQTDGRSDTLDDRETNRLLLQLVPDRKEQDLRTRIGETGKDRRKIGFHLLQLFPADRQIDTRVAEEPDDVPPPFQQRPMIRRVLQHPLQRLGSTRGLYPAKKSKCGPYPTLVEKIDILPGLCVYLEGKPDPVLLSGVHDHRTCKGTPMLHLLC